MPIVPVRISFMMMGMEVVLFLVRDCSVLVVMSAPVGEKVMADPEGQKEKRHRNEVSSKAGLM